VAECTRSCSCARGGEYSLPVPVALPLAAQPSLGPFVALLVVGFVVGIFGHLIRSSLVIVLGIGLVFIATVVGPLVIYGNPY
jgi:hypothetical protein